jgi:hypothetical protein
VSNTPPSLAGLPDLPREADLLSPRSPVFQQSSTPDPDFETRFWKAWELNMQRTTRLSELDHYLREFKYGKETAACYSPGATPEKVVHAYISRQADALRQYEQQSDSEDEELQQATSANANIRCKRGWERPHSRAHDLNGQDISTGTGDGDDFRS